MNVRDILPTQFKTASYAAAEHGLTHVCVSIRFLWTSLAIHLKYFGSKTDNKHTELSAFHLLQFAEGLRKAIFGFARTASVLVSDTTFFCVRCVASIDLEHEISGLVLYSGLDREWPMLLIRPRICAVPRHLGRLHSQGEDERLNTIALENCCLQ